jgi:His-Xaa-Ser system protein HxsD
MGPLLVSKTKTTMEFVDVQNGIARLQIDESLYSREAVLRTSYWFTDRCYVFISRPQPGCLLVSLRVKDPLPTLENPRPISVGTVAGEYQNALLDQQLRIDIERETKVIRELLVAKAFSEAGVMDDPPPGDPRDPVDIRAAMDLT